MLATRLFKQAALPPEMPAILGEIDNKDSGSKGSRPACCWGDDRQGAGILA